eukprot:2659780-Rhodomonas_salina.5
MWKVLLPGEIFSWSDPAILANNPDIVDVLPDEVTAPYALAMPDWGICSYEPDMTSPGLKRT